MDNPIKIKQICSKNKTQQGITLIMLIITIIILLILIGITIHLALGQNGIIKRTKEIEGKYNEQQAREKLEVVLLDMQADKVVSTSYNKDDYLTTKLEEKGMIVNGNNIVVDGWQFQIDRSVPRIISNEKQKLVTNEGLIGEVSKISKNGYYEVEVKVEQGETANYNVHVINYNGDLVLDGVNEVEGATLINKTYEFGNENMDTATATEDAKNTLVLKVNGNLTIDEGVILTACKSDEGFGGPKGMIISCSGTIVNNGTISMTARGAKAEGEDIYLWKNENGKYEYIPAIGGAEGKAISKKSSSAARNIGNPGANGTDRKTGGGGSGAIYVNRGYTVTSGAGSIGTSYSGGSGGGAANGPNKSITAQDGGINGTYGGKCAWSSGAGSTGGGAGNLGGAGTSAVVNGENGTGGLLVIYCEKIENNNVIEANGSKGGNGTIGGGSSGGGSINIFSNEIVRIGIISAVGGEKVGTETKGGEGGTGSITVGSVITGSFVCMYKNY